MVPGVSLKADFWNCELQSYSYSTNALHSFILVLFEKYAMLLEKQFSRRFDEVTPTLFTILPIKLIIPADCPAR